MFENFLRLFQEMDSYRKIVLFFLTGLCIAAFWFIYLLSDHLDNSIEWYSTPRILYIDPPCVLKRLRANIYSIAIEIPTDLTQNPEVIEYVVAVYVTREPNRIEFAQVCDRIVELTKSDDVENLLEPYYTNGR